MKKRQNKPRGFRGYLFQDRRLSSQGWAVGLMVIAVKKSLDSWGEGVANDLR